MSKKRKIPGRESLGSERTHKLRKSGNVRSQHVELVESRMRSGMELVESGLRPRMTRMS